MVAAKAGAMSPTRAKFYVSACAEGWRVLTADGRRASELFLTRHEAVMRAEGLARPYGNATVYVCGRGDDEPFRRDYGAARPSAG
jgi:hypothetical protein